MSDLAHDAAVGHHDEHESTGIENRKLGMWVFLSSEFLFFGALITNYLLYSNRPWFAGTYPAEIYDIPFTSDSSLPVLSRTVALGWKGTSPMSTRPRGHLHLDPS